MDEVSDGVIRSDDVVQIISGRELVGLHFAESQFYLLFLPLRTY